MSSRNCLSRSGSRGGFSRGAAGSPQVVRDGGLEGFPFEVERSLYGSRTISVDRLLLFKPPRHILQDLKLVEAVKLAAG